MSKEARQMPDKYHNFTDLQRHWKQGKYTLEECITQVLHTLIRFEEKKLQLDFKLLKYKPTEEEKLEVLESYHSLMLKAEANQFLKALGTDEAINNQAMNFILENMAALEMEFIQLERDCESMLSELDEKKSFLN
jgi:hypothetical protein